MTKLKLIAFSLCLNLMTSVGLAQSYSFAPLAQQIMPSVVSIEVKISPDVNTPEVVNGLTFLSSDGHSALGSGFVLEENGLIATCAHVLDDAEKVSVTLFDGSTFDAQIVGQDELSDLAVLKIEPEEPLNPLIFGTAQSAHIGDFVLAAGNPFGLGNSVSAGIVSGKARRFKDNAYEEYIQTDAAISQGFSGGPLVNMDGQIIGINNALISTDGSFQGVSFALAAEDAQDMLAMLKNGNVIRATLGVNFGLRHDKQLTALSVSDEQIAKENHLEVGDVILEMDGQQISSEKNFLKKVLFGPINIPFELTISRDGNILKQMVKTSAHVQKTEPKAQNASIPLIEETKDYSAAGLKTDGDVVLAVAPDSPAAQKGIEAGDVVLKANGEKLEQPDDLKFYIEEAENAHEPLMLEMQDNKTNEPYAVELFTGSANNDAH